MLVRKNILIVFGFAILNLIIVTTLAVWSFQTDAKLQKAYSDSSNFRFSDPDGLVDWQFALFLGDTNVNISGRQIDSYIVNANSSEFSFVTSYDLNSDAVHKFDIIDGQTLEFGFAEKPEYEEPDNQIQAFSYDARQLLISTGSMFSAKPEYVLTYRYCNNVLDECESFVRYTDLPVEP